MGIALVKHLPFKMTKLQFLSDNQSEMLAGGWKLPSLTSKTSSMEINNLISQSNVGSAWSTTTSLGAGGGRFRMPTLGASAGSGATNIQKNILDLNNYGFSFAI